jgi:hypothetical protein
MAADLALKKSHPAALQILAIARYCFDFAPCRLTFSTANSIPQNKSVLP